MYGAKSSLAFRDIRRSFQSKLTQVLLRRVAANITDRQPWRWGIALITGSLKSASVGSLRIV
jgi:hypothetical protein